MDVLERLRELQQTHGWSDYRIAREAGLSPNTVSNIYCRGNMPSLFTLQELSKAFGLTMSEFFAEGKTVEVKPEHQTLICEWETLTEDQKATVLHVIRSYKK